MQPKFDDPNTWTDPDYAPGLIWIKKKHAYWRVPKRYVDAGYSTSRQSLPSGPEAAQERASLCRRYTRDLLTWWASREPSAADFGTWAYLIRRYRTDDISTYANVKANTREGYDGSCEKWLAIIGKMRVEELTFETFMKIVQAMRDKGRSAAYIKRMATQLRGLASYGSLIKETQLEAMRVKLMLSGVRLPNPPRRSVHPTLEQILAITQAADEAGQFAWSTGILTQWEFSLRAVDVRGHWLNDIGNPITGGIVRNGRRWQDGLTWDMFDDHGFRKVISKTVKSMPEPIYFDLRDVPYLQDRYDRLRPAEPVGPVFLTNRDKLPFEYRYWSALWTKYRRASGVSEDVWMMDTRAGGITEARSMGADTFDLRDAAQHQDISTTSRYVRGRSKAVSNVVRMRQQKRNEGE